MTNVLNALQSQIQAAAAVASVDISETSTGGGGERVVLAKGKYLARLCEYLEYGVQPNHFDPKKDPKPICRLTFAVFPFSTDEQGNRIPGKFDEPVFVRSSDFTISNHEKAGLKKVYSRLNWRNDATKNHVAFFLGEAFLVGVDKKTSKDGKREYNSLDANDINPALDAMSGQPYPVPALDDKAYRVFLWDVPTKEQWDSLFIEGSRDDGTSKNFIQDTMLKALNFVGSPLEQLLNGGATLPAPQLDAVAAPTATATAVPAATVAPVVPASAPELTVPWAPEVPVV